MNVEVHYATPEHAKYAQAICELIESAAKARGTGIAKRDPKYVEKKINNGEAVIALSDKGDLAGFVYIETWQNKEYLANSGLVVHPDFRNLGLAKKIKLKVLKLSKEKFPGTKIFGITTSLAVLKINYELGYRPVTFSELTTDSEFWNGCRSCPNYDILERNERRNCLCTGMLLHEASNKFVIKEKGIIAKRFQRLANFKNQRKQKKK
ncbi:MULTISPECIES: GNAT family N-acetyltransferase [Reichenbachiella]|uniref:Acetyltransferase (GNAT) domain-containing protein n=1 Tax=Reichenbachiella agariperforans TaxID=156994 RepID=A0A1M6SNF0_REIAG|nr:MULTISPECIES: GNAT family N-acetyltransferase [Reichenbachiella]MBU2916206.1 GNAT family N-acetyltransferase [Reichenbachiella agariperforans]RJE75059.1 GNAT family N-acetyltransferase [Reichenbachiella sp. MSK19-1]SHK46274.1 Acetyltransferase (GNAT) domain-containing protein [Reichenbachiella agariperforans]